MKLSNDWHDFKAKLDKNYPRIGKTTQLSMDFADEQDTGQGCEAANWGSPGVVKMQVYRLEPKNGDTSDGNWEATTLKETCWVSADSDGDARLKVALATSIGTHREVGRPLKTSPWNLGHLTSCVPDYIPAREPPTGYLITETGTTFPLSGYWGPKKNQDTPP
jgi:hypothetical protein